MSGAALCARVVVEELLAHGVREVVLAPGSRSAPLAYELYEADKIGLLRLHVRVDERSAAFLALGLAKGGAGPVVVVTTSGTAAANLHPAVLEASHSRLPLVVITADRPTALADSGANQTTDQIRLFARHVRADAQLDSAGGAVGTWRFQLARLLVAATGRRSHEPGPVQLNLAFTEPLVGAGELDQAAPWHAELAVSDLVADPQTDVLALLPGPQTVVVAGDATPEVGRQASRFAEQARLPLLAEPSSNARGSELALGTYRLLLRSALGAEIERVVVFGHPTLSRPVNRLLADSGVEIVVVSPYASWSDPGLNASFVCSAVAADPAPDSAAWLQRWVEADETARSALDAIVADLSQTGGTLTGPALAAELWSGLGASDVLVVGSSNPIRDLDLVARQTEVPLVYANRGLAGIDGTVSTAVGIALDHETPTHALVGDLTFLHDSNGLLIGAAEPRPPLRIVVANDDGGSIFATLEYGQPSRMKAFERIFGTPHGTDLAALVAAHGHRHQRVERREQLGELLLEPPTGIEVVEVVVDRRHRRAQAEAINAIGARIG